MPETPAASFLYYGHSTVGLHTGEGRFVLIDPWVRGNPMCPDSLHSVDRIDAMLITHAHMDHIGDVVALAKEHVPEKVVASFELCAWLEAQGVANLAPMGLGGAQEVLGLEVAMVRADHSSGLIETDGRRILDGGVASGYCVRMPGGPSFYHAGDTALFSDMKLIAELYRPALGFVPIGDLFTMGPRTAAMACEFLGLARVVPIHYGTFPVLTGTVEAFREEIAARGVDCEVFALAPGDSMAAS